VAGLRLAGKQLARRTVSTVEASGAESPVTPAVVTDDREQSRYELREAGELAGFLTYRLRGQAISLVHTEIEPAYQGAGLATNLARFSLDDARKRGLAVLPFCPYVTSWLKKHPEYVDLVPQDRRAEFGLA
jgi:predicted GNAT family acetyltransferase